MVDSNPMALVPNSPSTTSPGPKSRVALTRQPPTLVYCNYREKGQVYFGSLVIMLNLCHPAVLLPPSATIQPCSCRPLQVKEGRPNSARMALTPSSSGGRFFLTQSTCTKRKTHNSYHLQLLSNLAQTSSLLLPGAPRVEYSPNLLPGFC